MMRRWSSCEQYDIDDDSCQNLQQNDDQDCFHQQLENGGGGCRTNRWRNWQDPSSNTSSSLVDSNDAGSRGSWRGIHHGEEENEEPPAISHHHNADVPWSINREEEEAPPPSSISVQMSIWRELYAGQPPEDPRDSWRLSSNDDAVLWRRNFYNDPTEEEELNRNGSGSYQSLTAPGRAGDNDDGGLPDGLAHEERRIAERFANSFFPAKGRAAALMSGGSLGGNVSGNSGGGSGSSTPKSRRRNKRKGCDSPRAVPDDTVTKQTEAPTVKDEAARADDMDDELVLPEPAVVGSRRQLSFDLFQLQNDDSNHSGGTYEPLTSHGMRPARGWASLELNSDFEDETATVSPRVLSPEMDEEPAGSYHIRPFGGRCIVKEPQEKRTTFVALGSLKDDHRRVGSRGLVMEPDETPTAARAKQLVQLICSLKEKVKLYEDAFEQRHGYRPSHHQKMDDRTTKRFLTELARARKELKQLKERHHHQHLATEPAAAVLMELAETTTSRTVDSAPGSITTTVTGHLETTGKEFASVEQTVVEVQEHLASNRQLAGRSEAIEAMTSKQMLDEKMAVQRALLYVESLHGRPNTYGHKNLLRPLYDRYRLLKRMVVRSGLSRSKEEVCDLAPILEYETLELSDTWSAAGQGSGGLHRHSAPPTPSLESMEEMNCRPSVAPRHLITPITGTDLRTESCLNWTSKSPPLPMMAVEESQRGKRQKFSLNIEENLHALPLNQLVEQMRHVREEKRRLRRAIRDLEADLLRHHHHHHQVSTVGLLSSGADVGQESLEPVYAQYRHARAKLRLLEALVAKHDGSATL